MNTQNWFKKKLDSIKDGFDFRLESLILNITEKISVKMKQKGMNRVKLAQSLNVSPPAVTKILNGTSNFTLKTLLSIADALDLTLKIEFEDKSVGALKHRNEAQTIVQLAYDDGLGVFNKKILTKAHSTASAGEFDIAA